MPIEAARHRNQPQNLRQQTPTGQARAPLTLDSINGWRGPGALAIAFAHFSVAFDFIAYKTLVPLTLLVDLFFVFSGIVIAHTYTEKLSRPAAIPEYIVRRFGRIWPVHAVLLALLVAYELSKLAAHAFFGKQFSAPPFATDGINLVQAVWTNLLLIHSLGVHDRETWNFPSWSLSVEFFTYAIFALYCLAPPFTRRIASLATIVAALAVLVVVAPGHMRSTFDYGVFRCLAGFFAGALCYDAVKSWRLPQWPWPTLVEVIAVVLTCVWLARCGGTFWAFTAPLVYCLFMIAFVEGRGVVSAVLRTKPLQVLAELSFSIYMVHAVVLLGFLALLHQYEHMSGAHLFVRVINPLAGHPGAPPTVDVARIQNHAIMIALVVAYMLAVLVASFCAYRLVEVPGRAFFGSIAKKLRPTSKPAVTTLAQPAEGTS